MMLSDLLATRPVKRVLLTSLKGKTTRTNALTPQEKTASGKLVDGRFHADYASCARLGIRTLIVAFTESKFIDMEGYGTGVDCDGRVYGM